MKPDKRRALLKRTKYPWPGVSFTEWLAAHPSELKYSSRAKCRREFQNRALSYGPNELSQQNRFFQVIYSDELSHVYASGSLLARLIKREPAVGAKYPQPVKLEPEIYRKADTQEPKRSSMEILRSVIDTPKASK